MCTGKLNLTLDGASLEFWEGKKEGCALIFAANKFDTTLQKFDEIGVCIDDGDNRLSWHTTRTVHPAYREAGVGWK